MKKSYRYFFVLSVMKAINERRCPNIIQLDVIYIVIVERGKSSTSSIHPANYPILTSKNTCSIIIVSAIIFNFLDIHKYAQSELELLNLYYYRHLNLKMIHEKQWKK